MIYHRYTFRMSYPTTVQLIQRKSSQQWYVNLPAALANAMDFDKGETVEWTLLDRSRLLLIRRVVPAAPLTQHKARATQKRKGVL
jgi:hypothetical protein